MARLPNIEASLPAFSADEIFKMVDKSRTSTDALSDYDSSAGSTISSVWESSEPDISDSDVKQPISQEVVHQLNHLYMLIIPLTKIRIQLRKLIHMSNRSLHQLQPGTITSDLVVKENLLLPMAHQLRSHALLMYFRMVEGKLVVAMVVVVMMVMVVVVAVVIVMVLGVEKDVVSKEALFNMILFRMEALFNRKVLFQIKRVKRPRLILWMLYLSQQ